MTRATSSILWTVASGRFTVSAAGFFVGLVFFVAHLLDSRINMIAIGPVHIMVIFVIGAVGGLVLAFRGKLPGTRGGPK